MGVWRGNRDARSVVVRAGLWLSDAWGIQNSCGLLCYGQNYGKLKISAATYVVNLELN